MRLFLFKIFYKLAVFVFPCKERSVFLRKYCLNQILLHERDVDMQKCVRPRSYPRLRGITRHSDYFESAEEWEK